MQDPTLFTESLETSLPQSASTAMQTISRVSTTDVVSGKKSSLSLTTGFAYPLGATRLTQVDQSWNFAVAAPDALQLWLCIFCADTEELIHKVAFLARTGPVWHIQVTGLADGSLYGFMVEGDSSDQSVNADRLLIDPYAKKLNRAAVFNERLYQSKSHFMVPKAVLCDLSFDWQGSQKPKIAAIDTVIYEAHVKGLTKLHPAVPAELRGTYLGMAHPAIVQHIKQLGITTVQLLPVTAFMSEPRLEQLKLTNYWGYNPIAFMAPEPRYQYEDAVTELKTLVRTYHQAGIEVIMDVVFNHTAEADRYVLSWRGLADRQYYWRDDQTHAYCNYTGCGNSVDVSQPITRQLVLDALRYWLTEYHIDGFRFDLAVTLAREQHQFQPHALFLQICAQDPIISQAKLIAEPWDIGPYGYQLGQFPAPWSELNDQYRDTVRSFWKGDPHTIANFATRLAGSRDVFSKHHRSAAASVNYLTYHDGFNLHDVVCYLHKHNWLNAEQNRDGHDHNLSVNYGVEGPSAELPVINKRYQHKRNLVATLCISQGIMHWLAGDELSHSQQGNNNAYCQDNAITWINWQLDYHQEQFLRFVQYMLQLRQRLPLCGRLLLQDDEYQRHGDRASLYWYRPDGSVKQAHDWHDPQLHSLSFVIQPSTQRQAMLVLIHAGGSEQHFVLPPLQWYRIVDTSRADGAIDDSGFTALSYTQAPQSMSIWIGQMLDETAQTTQKA